jgi:hypothetical protein
MPQALLPAIYKSFDYARISAKYLEVSKKSFYLCSVKGGTK